MRIESCRDQVAALHAVFDDVNNSDEVAEEFELEPGDLEYYPRMARRENAITFPGLDDRLWGYIIRNDEVVEPYRIRYSWFLMQDTSQGSYSGPAENIDSGTTYTNQEAYVQLENAAYGKDQQTLF